MSRRTFSRTLVFAAMIAAASAVVTTTARAQKPDSPAVVLTAKSAGELIADLRYLVTAVAPANEPQVAQVLAALDSLKNPENLQGLDPSKPLGMFGSLPEGDQPPSAVIFLPVLNSKTLLDMMNQNGVTVEEDKSAPGFTHKVTLPNTPLPLFVTEGNGYLYLSLAATGADTLKAMKPESLLPTRKGAGDLSLTIRLDRLGPQFQEGFNTGLENSIAAQRERQANETDEAYKARLAFIKAYQDAFVTLVRDGKELSLDLVIDPKAEFLGVELNSSAVAGTPYAAALRKLTSLTSRFRGLTSNAVIAGSVAVPLSKGIRDTIGVAIDGMKAKSLTDPKAAGNEVAKKVIEEMFGSMRATFTAESVDMAMSIQGPNATSGKFVGVVAMAVKDGKALDSALRDATKVAPAENKKTFMLDAGKTADGTPIHKFLNPEPPSNPAVAAAFGENNAYVAFSDTLAVFAMGTDGQAAVTSAFASAKAPAAEEGGSPQVEVAIAASRIADFASTPAEKEAMKTAASEVFGNKTVRKDRVSMTIKGTGDAMTLRIGSDVPALKFMGAIGSTMGKVIQ